MTVSRKTANHNMLHGNIVCLIIAKCQKQKLQKALTGSLQGQIQDFIQGGDVRLWAWKYILTVFLTIFENTDFKNLNIYIPVILFILRT